MKELSLTDVKDILTGCTILGTGGGGGLDKGLELVEADYAAGLRYAMAGMDEVEADGLYTCPYFCGSIGPQAEGDRYAGYPKTGELETVAAVRALEDYLGKKASGVVSVEYGGKNTAVAMSTGARLGLPIVDADGAGRAVPDLQFSTFYANGFPIAPLAVADAIGDVAVFAKVADDFRAEDLVRALSVVSGGLVGMTDHPCAGRDLARATIPGALSYAQGVGKARRLALEMGRDPVAEVIAAADGYLLFEGVVSKDTEWKNEAGFTVGTISFDGAGRWEGRKYAVWFKNENVIAWEDGKALATVPDLICAIETGTAYPTTNPFCKKGMRMSVLGFKAPAVWRSGRGLSILNPAFFGFKEEWTPIEKTMEGRKA